jgi:hypothetical protein
MCIFPDDPANLGRVAYVDIWKNGDKWYHDCYDEADYSMVIKQKIIHKKDPIVNELVEVLKGFYRGEYKVVEKMTREEIINYDKEILYHSER